MSTGDSRMMVDQLAGARRSILLIETADALAIRAEVRSLVKAHGRLRGELWDAQADHAEKVVGEIIDSQGLAAGRVWAAALAEELQADFERSVFDREHPCGARTRPGSAAAR